MRRTITSNLQQFAICNTLVKQNAGRGHSAEDVIKRPRDVDGHVLYGMLHKLHEPDHFTSWPLYTSHHAANHVGRFVLLAKEKITTVCSHIAACSAPIPGFEFSKDVQNQVYDIFTSRSAGLTSLGSLSICYLSLCNIITHFLLMLL